jgi:hypothetical protein
MHRKHLTLRYKAEAPVGCVAAQPTGGGSLLGGDAVEANVGGNPLSGREPA